MGTGRTWNFNAHELDTSGKFRLYSEEYNSLISPQADWMRSPPPLEKQAPAFLTFFKIAISPGPTVEGLRGIAAVLVDSGRNCQAARCPDHCDKRDASG